jgi:hypothetical protein
MNLHMGLISPTFYVWLFCMKVLRETFLYLDLRFVLFWRKNIGAKAECIMLFKLTHGEEQGIEKVRHDIFVMV